MLVQESIEDVEITPEIMTIAYTLMAIFIVVDVILAIWVYTDAKKNGINPAGYLISMLCCGLITSGLCGCVGCVSYLVARSQRQNQIRMGGYNQQYYGPNAGFPGGYQQMPMNGNYGQPGVPPSQYPRYSQGQPIPAQNPNPNTIMPQTPYGMPNGATTMPKKQCKICGAETDQAAKFCPVCGSNF